MIKKLILLFLFITIGNSAKFVSSSKINLEKLLAEQPKELQKKFKDLEAEHEISLNYFKEAIDNNDSDNIKRYANITALLGLKAFSLINQNKNRTIL
jgi:hypothetical protein